MAVPHAGPESEVLERHANPGALPTKMSFTIVSPAGKLGEGVADELTAPGVQGEFTVLPGHIPFLSALKAGVLSWKDASGKHLLAVDKGYLQVGANSRLVVLVEKAMTPAQIDLGKAREDAAKQSEALKHGFADQNDAELARLALEWAEARVATHERAHGKGDAGAH
jgi:F-type H+-transporting ATPase subunit epsilon